MRRRWTPCLRCVLLFTAALSASYFASTISAADASPSIGLEVPGLAALNVGQSAFVGSISCSSPGNCAAGGSFSIMSSQVVSPRAYVVNEVSGHWTNAIAVPGISSLDTGHNSSVVSISCASPGNCSAGGNFTNKKGSQAFVVNERNGKWTNALKLSGPDAFEIGGTTVSSVSCASPGNCSAGGFYGAGLRSRAFVVNEIAGRWLKATDVPGVDALDTGQNSSVASVSCASPGNCSAGGHFTNAKGSQAFVANERNGTWATALHLSGPIAFDAGGSNVASLSCASPGNCSAGGSIERAKHSEAFVANERNGTWGIAIKVPGTANLGARAGATVSSISCASSGNCAAGGQVSIGERFTAFVDDEVGGRWKTIKEIPGLAALPLRWVSTVSSISCASSGNCAAGGYDGGRQGSSQAFMVNETDGIWREVVTISVPSSGGASKESSVNAVSCATPNRCNGGGTYLTRTASQAFVTP